MKCLEGYIGLRGCGETEPESELYINELPGVNLKLIDQISDVDQVTYKRVWADVQKRALKRFESSVISYFSTKYRLRRLFDRYRFGQVFDTANTIAAGNEKRGVLLQIDKNSTLPSVSPLVVVNFSNVEYYSPVVATMTFSLVDQDTTQVYWTSSVDLVGGWNSVLKNWSAPALTFGRNVALFVEVTQATVETLIGTPGGGCFCGCSLGGCCTAELTGFRYDNATTVLTETPNNGHGFRGFVSLQCSYDGLVCGSKSLFATALWYLLGAELMVERMFTDRINAYTTVDKKKGSELHSLFEQRFVQEISQVVEGIDLRTTDCCLDCDAQVYDRTTIG